MSFPRLRGKDGEEPIARGVVAVSVAAGHQAATRNTTKRGKAAKPRPKSHRHAGVKAAAKGGLLREATLRGLDWMRYGLIASGMLREVR